MSKFVIEEQSVDSLKENYNKVIFQKQMLVAQSEKKKMETAKSMDRYENEYLIEKDTFLDLDDSNHNLLKYQAKNTLTIFEITHYA